MNFWKMADATSKTESRRCTRLKHIRTHFLDIWYVCVSKQTAFPFSPCPDGQGTCAMHCRYGDCEHAEFVRMLPLRVRSATISADKIPGQRPRGRKCGATTSRGRLQAAKKAAGVTLRRQQELLSQTEKAA